MRRNRLILMVCLSGLILQACEPLNNNKNPHNDVLVFGTSTKFALDVSAPIQNGGVPEFTLGYKRLEAVWMPLKPNGAIDESPDDDMQKLLKRLAECTLDDSIKKVFTSEDEDKIAAFCLTFLLPKGKYVSVSSGLSPDKGGQALEVDTYSVFASLGGKGTLGFQGASGSIAQFFATGVAAQRLGANQSIDAALNAKVPEAEAQKAEANTKEADAIATLVENGASLEQAALLVKGTDNIILEEDREAMEAKGCILGWGKSLPANFVGNDKIEAVVKHSNNTERLISELKRDDQVRTDILKVCREQ